MDAANAAVDTGALGTGSADGLTERDLRILAFERQWWKYAGAKEQAVRELFDMSATRYYQVLNALIDRPEALACRPHAGQAAAPAARVAPAGQVRAPARHRGLSGVTATGVVRRSATLSAQLGPTRRADPAVARQRS